MIGVSVRSNVGAVLAEFRALKAGIKDKATERALNRAMDSAATETKKKIREVYNVRLAAISRALKKKPAHGKQAVQVATLRVRGTRFGLIEFSATAIKPWNVKGKNRRKGGGVSVRIKKSGGRKLIKHAFIAATGTGYRGVFIRLSKAPPGYRLKGGGQAYKDPIVNLRSISVPAAFMHDAVIAAVQQAARDSFVKNFRQQVKYLRGK